MGDISITIFFDSEKDYNLICKLENVNDKQEYIKQLIEKDNETHKRGRKYTDLAGMRFGKWTVIERDYEKTKPGRTMWFCQCDCGTKSSVIAQALIKGTSTQCKKCRGRSRRNITRKDINGKRTATYNTWDAMIHRCCYPNHVSYANYGGRGITVCDEWKNYDVFYDYVSKLDRFGESGMTIDRIDNSKGYEPGNVRWATRAEQNKHRRDRDK